MVQDRARIRRLISRTVEAFSLDLTDCCVFTEAATGQFAVTAPIAAAAGASVYAYAADSSYGSKEEAFAETNTVAQALECSDSITYLSEMSAEKVGEADILTNTGFVRPIDKEVVSAIKPTGVVPLMYEPWEFRGDVNVRSCWERGIPVIGTDESDPRVRTQEYVGLIPVKKSFELGIEVMKSHYLVIGGGNMASFASEKLGAVGGDVTRLDPRDKVAKKPDFDSIDAIVVVDNLVGRELIGPDGLISVNRIEALTDDMVIIHICGAVNVDRLETSFINYVPESPAAANHMSFTAGEVGPLPVIELHTASLAVGEIAMRTRRAGGNLQEAVDAAVEETVGADFNKEFKRDHGHPNFR